MLSVQLELCFPQIILAFFLNKLLFKFQATSPDVQNVKVTLFEDLGIYNTRAK